MNKNEFLGRYMISVSDGHDWDFDYYDSSDEAYFNFDEKKQFQDDLHLYEWSNRLQCYEVIDSWSSEIEKQ